MREGAKSGVGRRERIKRERGTQGRDERSNGIEKLCPRLVTELEHLKIETRLIDEMFASEMGEYVFLM